MEIIHSTNTQNIGIFAHVDAGKTTITEQLLFEAGVLEKTGRVDHGDTVTDSMDQEKKHGITIQSQPVSFSIGNIKINLIDTPGHSDFIAEVERSMQVLDGAILVLSAKEGVQSHTKLLFSTLRKMNIPFIIFINKIDRLGADIESVIEDIHDSLCPFIFLAQNYSQVGSRHATISSKKNFGLCSQAELIAEFDEKIFESFIQNLEIAPLQLLNQGTALAQQGKIHPIFLGNALAGIGISELFNAIPTFLPSQPLRAEGETAFQVFKIKRNKKDQKQHYIKVRKGRVMVRDCIQGSKITRIEQLQNGKEPEASYIEVGDIGIIYGVDLPVNAIVGDFDRKSSMSLGLLPIRHA
jgi:ribosomal protection tetracycline resistance protein